MLSQAALAHAYTRRLDLPVADQTGNGEWQNGQIKYVLFLCWVECSPIAIIGRSGEVFQKAMLSISSEVTKDCVRPGGKQKRKERLPKPKSSGQKVRMETLYGIATETA